MPRPPKPAQPHCPYICYGVGSRRGYICLVCTEDFEEPTPFLARLATGSAAPDKADSPLLSPVPFFEDFLAHAFDGQHALLPDEVLGAARTQVALLGEPDEGLQILAEHNLIYLPPHHMQSKPWW